MRKFGPVVFSFLGGVAGAIAFLGIVGARPVPQKVNRGDFDSITARSIYVVDADGNRVIGLVGARSARPEPVIWIRNKGGAPSATLEPDEIMLLDGEGNDLVSVFVGKLGPQIVLKNREKTAEAYLAALPMGSAIAVRPYGKVSPDVSLNYFNSKVALDITDGGGRSRVTAGQTSLVTKSSGVKEETPIGSITIFDEVGNLVWREPR